MKILITNDDGFKSEGIRLLKRLVRSFASEIWVVAPSSNRSGSARSLSYPMSQSIIITEHGKKEFSVSGTPTDCVIIALNKILDKKPDLILSGVNIGSNVGNDVYYSGTIGAVMEGAARYIPSIALSQVYRVYSNTINWYNTKIFAPRIITKLFEIGWPKNIAMSVNLPDIKKVKGIEFVEQGEYKINRDLTFIENPDGSLRLNWSRNYLGSGSVSKIEEGFITITPIKLDFTDYDTLNIMKNFYANEFF